LSINVLSCNVKTNEQQVCYYDHPTINYCARYEESEPRTDKEDGGHYRSHRTEHEGWKVQYGHQKAKGREQPTATTFSAMVLSRS
jgi:hypothetical protein